MTFDPTKPVQTRCGYPARILATDVRGKFPVIAAVEKGGTETVFQFGLDGDCDETTRLDLINIPQKHVRWVNVYATRADAVHKSKDLADAYCSHDRIACIRIEFQEGEGL